MEIPSRILNIDNKSDEKFLRKKTASFDFTKYSKNDITDLIAKMRAIMHTANGQGLAANQIGMDISMFVAVVDNKFYAVFNPVISNQSAEKEVYDGEGCLSVTGRYGTTRSPAKLMLEGQDRNGKKIKIKAWGILALTFQHEVDHLNGKLFIDRQ